MHFYWRIIEELKFLGEIVVFKDPNLLRCYKFWLEEHAGAITLSTTDDTRFAIGGKPHRLSFVELWILKGRETNECIV